MTITKDNKIGEILKMDMNIAGILMNSGMHCVGCPSAQHETLAEAGQVHGIDTDGLVEEINAYLSSAR